MKNLTLTITMAIAVIASIAILLFALYNDPKVEGSAATYYSVAIFLTYLCIAVAVLALFFFPVIYMIQNPKSTKGTLIGVGVLVGVLLISYIIAAPEQGEFYTKFEISPSMSKIIGGGLIATYIFLGVALLGSVFAAVSERFK